jgi:hypothetical protein
MEDTKSTQPIALGTSEKSGPTIQVLQMAQIPMASTIEDQIAYQHLRNEDFKRAGVSLYNNQRIVFNGHCHIDMLDPRYTQTVRPT